MMTNLVRWIVLGEMLFLLFLGQASVYCVARGHYTSYLSTPLAPAGCVSSSHGTLDLYHMLEL